KWPTLKSGPIAEAPGETWRRVDAALRHGLRGLPGGNSLAELLARSLRIRNRTNVPRLTVSRIVTLADAHYRRTGRWPMTHSGKVVETEGETWHALDAALRQGKRGLPGGSSLAQLLQEQRGVPNKSALPRLTLTSILQWADLHHTSTGRWPMPRPHVRHGKQS